MDVDDVALMNRFVTLPAPTAVDVAFTDDQCIAKIKVQCVLLSYL